MKSGIVDEFGSGFELFEGQEIVLGELHSSVQETEPPGVGADPEIL